MKCPNMTIVTFFKLAFAPKLESESLVQKYQVHTWKKRVMWRGWLFWPKKLAEKVRKSRQNVNRDKSA